MLQSYFKSSLYPRRLLKASENNKVCADLCTQVYVTITDLIVSTSFAQVVEEPMAIYDHSITQYTPEY